MEQAKYLVSYLIDGFIVDRVMAEPGNEYGRALAFGPSIPEAGMEISAYVNRYKVAEIDGKTHSKLEKSLLKNTAQSLCGNVHFGLISNGQFSAESDLYKHFALEGKSLKESFDLHLEQHEQSLKDQNEATDRRRANADSSGGAFGHRNMD